MPFSYVSTCSSSFTRASTAALAACVSRSRLSRSTMRWLSRACGQPSAASRADSDGITVRTATSATLQQRGSERRAMLRWRHDIAVAHRALPAVLLRSVLHLLQSSLVLDALPLVRLDTSLVPRDVIGLEHNHRDQQPCQIRSNQTANKQVKPVNHQPDELMNKQTNKQTNEQTDEPTKYHHHHKQKPPRRPPLPQNRGGCAVTHRC
jgi:hypothetical protein